MNHTNSMQQLLFIISGQIEIWIQNQFADSSQTFLSLQKSHKSVYLGYEKDISI